MELGFGRLVHQAGCFVNGIVTVNISSKDKEQIKQFNAGALIELHLYGFESSYWATG